MPLLTRVTLRCSLGYFIAGTGLGSLLLLNKGWHFLSKPWVWLQLHMEWVLIGWMVQFVLAVAYWMFPRAGLPPIRPRPELATASFVLLNLGIGFTSLGFVWQWKTAAVLPGHFLECSAILLFAIHIWPRIKPFRSEESSQ